MPGAVNDSSISAGRVSAGFKGPIMEIRFVNRTAAKSKIYRATVAHTDLRNRGPVTIDQELLGAAGTISGTQFAIADVINGARLETCAIAGERGSDVGANGAGAHLVKERAVSCGPQIVHVDASNEAVGVGGGLYEPRVQGLQRPPLAGAFPNLMGKVPSDIAAAVDADVGFPTTGIGAMKAASGQVLALQYMARLCRVNMVRLVIQYANLHSSLLDAGQEQCDDLRYGEFPSAEYCFESGPRQQWCRGESEVLS
jgi:aspartate 1-decarboxylase